MLTQEKADILSSILTQDEDRTRNLLSIEPMQALEQINSLGYSFTLDDINEFGAALKANTAENEVLDINDLEDVAGGVRIFSLIRSKTVAFIKGIAKKISW